MVETIGDTTIPKAHPIIKGQTKKGKTKRTKRKRKTKLKATSGY